jgi:PAS domain S-box-containing protein
MSDDVKTSNNVKAVLEDERLPEPSRESSVLDAVSVAIWSIDECGIIQTYNASAQRLLGYSSDEVIDTISVVAFHDKYELATRALEIGAGSGLDVLVHAARIGQSEAREWTYVRKDGTRFPALLTISPLRNKAQNVIGFVGCAEDISFRQGYIHDLQKRALVASRTHNLVIVTDAVAHVEWVNDAFTRVTGYTYEEVRGRKIGQLVQGPDTDQAVVRVMRESVIKGEGFQVEVLNYGKDGRTYWLDIDCRPVHGKDGTLQGFVAVETDITVRKTMEERLRESEARLRAFVTALPDMVFRLSRDGVFLDVHAPHEELLILPRDAFLGRRPVDVLPTELATAIMSTADRARRENAPQIYEYRLNIRGVEHDFEARVVPGQGEDVLVIVRDVSERKLLDTMKDEFVSTVSHELRTPLTAIQGTLGLLGGGVLGPLERDAQELVLAALSNSERLGRLINDILDLDRVSRRELELKLQLQPLAPLIEAAVAETAAFAAEFNVTYLMNELTRNARSTVDSDRFVQVMNNILSNAAKYGNGHDVVRVGIEAVGLSWRVYVRNRGTPIPEVFRRRLFHRFSVLDGTDMRSRQGSGLGLAITKTLVERMGGQIDYISTNEYTEFFLTFPAE